MGRAIPISESMLNQTQHAGGMNPQHVRYLERQRDIELTRVFDHSRQLLEGKQVLEVGSGTGRQMLAIGKIASQIVGVDVRNGMYNEHRQPTANIIEYDGRTLPFESGSFDVVFSSHVLEHFTDETTSHREMLRVLKKDGYGIHVVPTTAARLLTMIMHYPDAVKRLVVKATAAAGIAEAPTYQKARYSLGYRVVNTLIPSRHGEYGNWFTEAYEMSHHSWKVRLERNGWRVQQLIPLKLAYSMYGVLADRVSWKARTVLSRFLGSASMMIVAVRK